MARVLVVLTDDAHPVGPMAAWLGESGCAIEECLAYEEAVPQARAFHGLIVLGGETSTDAGAWQTDVADRIREAAVLGVPTLGIGFGHQLAARALGGTVAPSPYGRRAGLLEVGWGCEVLLDPLFDRIAGEARASHEHSDVVTVLPPDGVVLARTGDGDIQAARLAATVWGVQFHPEEFHPEADETDDWRPLTWAFARLVRGRAAARGEMWE